jgi:hypothetical protein
MLEWESGIFEMPRLAAREIGLPVAWRGEVKLERKTVVQRPVAVTVLGV